MLYHRDSSSRSVVVIHVFLVSTVVLLITVYMVTLNTEHLHGPVDVDTLRAIAKQLIDDQLRNMSQGDMETTENVIKRLSHYLLNSGSHDEYYSAGDTGMAKLLGDVMNSKANSNIAQNKSNLNMSLFLTNDNKQFNGSEDNESNAFDIHSIGTLPTDVANHLLERPKLTQLPIAFQKEEADDIYINLLNSPAPEYLANYKNPCWAESLRPRDGMFDGHYWWGAQLKKRMETAKTYLPSTMAHRLKEGRDWKIRCLPYFYIAGVTKGGTTDLFAQLSHHPRIASSVKETHWWSRLRSGDANGIDGMHVPIKQYIDLLDTAALQIEKSVVRNMLHNSSSQLFHPMILGDGSPSYFWYNERWRMRPESNGTDGPLTHVGHYIRHVTPDARIILCFRNPVLRTYSHYLYTAGSRASREDFHSTVVSGIQQVKACLQANKAWYCANYMYDRPWARLNIGMYALFLEKWFEVFPRNQFFILRLEEYASNRTNIINQVFRFLGIGEIPEAEVESWDAYGVKNKHEPASPMLNETMKLLQDFYRPHNEHLANLLRDVRYLWK